VATDDAMDDASIRGVIDMPIRDAIAGTAEIALIGASAVIGPRDVRRVGSAWRDAVARDAVARDAVAAVVIVTAVASAAVTRTDASVLWSVAITKPVVRKAKAIATRVGAAKGRGATAIEIAATPTGPMEIAWRQAIAPVANPTSMTTSEIASKRR
jgi:hypothetical protein